MAAEQNPATARTLHPLRAKGRAIAADLAARAQEALVAAGGSACTDRAIALRFDLNKNVPASWFKPTSGAGLYLGDVLALPRELSRDILTRALASLDDSAGPDERETIERLTIELGRAAERLRDDVADDGVINQHARHADSFLRVATIALRGYLAALRLGGAR